MNLSSHLLRTLHERLAQGSPVILRSHTAGIGCAPPYSFGIEEEYFLVDERTLDIATSSPDGLFAEATWTTGGQAMREMTQAQIEVVTNVHTSVVDAREELRFLRDQAGAAAQQFGFRIMACGTHPTAEWRSIGLTPKARYIDMIDDLKQVGRRNMLCGMHVHVQLPDPDHRIQVMSSLIPFVPLFIALSTSSPFWQAHKTGLKGYRLAAYDELPRTGIPPLFQSSGDYHDYVDALKGSGVIPDESFIWWVMRPSSRHPTLELRAPDCCTNINDAIAIASLYRSLARHLTSKALQLTSEVDRAIAVENKWRAQRYGTECIFVSRDGPVPLKDLLSDIISRVADDAEDLGCIDQVLHCKQIAMQGSSADKQLEQYENGSLQSVKRWLADETLA
jgi:carboxylate-amine ligase